MLAFRTSTCKKHSILTSENRDFKTLKAKYLLKYSYTNVSMCSSTGVLKYKHHQCKCNADNWWKKRMQCKTALKVEVLLRTFYQFSPTAISTCRWSAWVLVLIVQHGENEIFNFPSWRFRSTDTYRIRCMFSWALEITAVCY